MRLIDCLSQTGLRRLEVTSFVRPDVIPQLADAEEVLRSITRNPDVAYSVLIPNERGLERALAGDFGFDEVNLFLSASETHNRKNVNRSVEESLSGLERVVAQARDAGLRCEGVISVSFGCPYEGEVPLDRVFDIARRLAAAGCEEVAFGDTTGMANPMQVRGFFARAFEELPGVELTAHFHNTRGQGLANVLAALESGVGVVRELVRRAGRLPRAGAARRATSRPRTWSRCCTRWASRPASTWSGCLGARAQVQEVLGRPLSAHLLTAGPVDWHRG